MKKVLLFILLHLFFIGTLHANPPIVYHPTPYISELAYDDDENWVLELYLDSPYFIDSLFIASSTGKSKVDTVLNEDFFQKDTPLLVIKESDMKNSLNINPAGDSITFIVYDATGFTISSSLPFGNYQHATVKAPTHGESIINISQAYEPKYPYYEIYCRYAKCSAPNIGGWNYNDKDAAKGTIKGSIYKDGVPFISSNPFVFVNSDIFYIDAQGNYEAKVYANITTYNTIRTKQYSFSSYYSYKAAIEPFVIDMEPNGVVERDIYILTDFSTKIEQPTANNPPIKTYPNPLKKGSSLHYEISIPFDTQVKTEFEILTLTGKVIHKESVTSNKGTILFSTNSITTGSYILRCLMNQKECYSKVIVIEK